MMLARVLGIAAGAGGVDDRYQVLALPQFLCTYIAPHRDACHVNGAPYNRLHWPWIRDSLFYSDEAREACTLVGRTKRSMHAPYQPAF